MLHIYCGDGKGKTTAALGLALRAAGSGMHVCIVQFMKGRHTSELNSLLHIPEITVLRCDRDYGFSFQMDDAVRAAVTACHDRLLQQAADMPAEMLVLDEFFAAWRHKLLDREAAMRLVTECRAELVLTGRDPDAVFLEMADYVSDIHAVRHPYEKGIPARKGIEY